MDFGFVKFLCDLERTMASIEAKLERLITFFLSERGALLDENASLKEQLAQEELDDQSLQDEAAAARKVAAANQAKADELQVLADADLAQDERLGALISGAEELLGLPSLDEPAPEEPVEEEPVIEPTPEEPTA